MALLKKLFIKQAENNKFGVVDKDNNWFLEPKYSKAWRTGSYIIIGRKGKWAVIDALKGEWIDDIEDYFYDNEEDSFEYGALKLTKKWKDKEEIEYLFDNGDKQNNEIDEIDDDFLKRTVAKALHKMREEEGNEREMTKDEEGNSKYDYLDRKILPQRDDNDKWGYVNEKNEWIIPAQYDLAKAFVNGTAIVKLEDKYGIIFDDGSYAVEPELDDAWSWEEFIIARKGEKDEWGVMDRYGEWLWGGNLHTIEGPTIRNKEANIITHDYLDLWDDNGDGNKLFSGGTFEEIDDYGIYYKGFEEDDD